jgi:hypothetical protein
MGGSPISQSAVCRVTLLLEYDYKGKLPKFTYKSTFEDLAEQLTRLPDMLIVHSRTLNELKIAASTHEAEEMKWGCTYD